MRRLFLLAAGIAIAIPFGVPAHADTPTDWVELGYERQLVPLDSGYEVAVLCDASALTNDQTHVAVATSVECSVNGFKSARAMPGRESYVVVNATVTGPYTVCISGQAAFVHPVDSDTVVPSAGPQCQTWPL